MRESRDVMPESPKRNRNFSQISLSITSVSSAWMWAFRQAARDASLRVDCPSRPEDYDLHLAWPPLARYRALDFR
jgi:hypothetical protein